MTLEELRATYKNFSTQELLDIVQVREGYTDAAITAALQELRARGVSNTDKEIFVERQLEKAKDFVSKNIHEDLHFFEKNFFYFLWHPLLHGAFKQNLRDGGYVLKLKQASYYSWLGFIFLLIMSLVAVQFDLSALQLFTGWMFCFLVAALFDEFVNRKRQIKKLLTLYGNPHDGDQASGDIIFKWQKEGIRLNGSATEGQFAACEQKLGFVLPDDFKAFYRRVNGFSEWQMDSKQLALWSLELMQAEQPPGSDFIAFADYMANSHRIGYIKGQEGIFRSYNRTFICATFDEFVSHWERESMVYM